MIGDHVSSAAGAQHLGGIPAKKMAILNLQGNGFRLASSIGWTRTDDMVESTTARLWLLNLETNIFCCCQSG